MHYKIIFEEFSIEASTSLTSFYDFIVQVEQGYSDGTVVNFLLQNYE